MKVTVWIKGETFTNEVTRESGEGSFELHRDKDTITIQSGNFDVSLSVEELAKLFKLGRIIVNEG